ncbi:MAG: LacI family DNA-binding transcriptional regulator [Eubacteriales bacterium]
MSVTIKKIAEVSGVSRGTVDRVLNNRGNVHRGYREAGTEGGAAARVFSESGRQSTCG